MNERMWLWTFTECHHLFFRFMIHDSDCNIYCPLNMSVFNPRICIIVDSRVWLINIRKYFWISSFIYEPFVNFIIKDLISDNARDITYKFTLYLQCFDLRYFCNDPRLKKGFVSASTNMIVVTRKNHSWYAFADIFFWNPLQKYLLWFVIYPIHEKDQKYWWFDISIIDKDRKIYIVWYESLQKYV